MNKTAIRQSNIELLRIISMFMVMVLHATQAIGYPEMSVSSGVEYYLLGLAKALCIVSVNVFVMISGWFGIRFSFKGLFRFLFQVLFFSIVGYLITVLLKVNSFSVSDFFAHGLMFSSRNYWFVDCYLLLFVLAPALNMFCENAERRQLEVILLTMLCIQTIAAWILPTLQAELKGGYSAVSFAILYMIARYVRIHNPKWSSLKLKYDVAIYLALTLMLSIIAYFTRGGGIALVDFYSYTSPFVIIASLFVLLAFTKFVFHNKVVNYIASSAFAVYLLHEHFSVREPLYRSIVGQLYSSEAPYVSCLFDTIGFMLIVYVVAILIDKLRLMVSRLLIRK